MPSFASGVVKFQREVFPEKKALFEVLSHGQSPEALFITCSDSRIETSMITQTNPGELFVCRNPGNIVPPYEVNTSGVTASIEYAVSVLKVGHIVICGHTECGAMNGAVCPDAVAHMPHVADWLTLAHDAVKRVDHAFPNLDEGERLKRITRQNVIVQLEHLADHPTVRERLEKGDLKIHGWVYDIKSGDVYVFDQDRNEFIPIAEKYAERFAKEAGKTG